MNEMRVASIALAAYLVSSALRVHHARAFVVAVERQVQLAHQLQRALPGLVIGHTEHDAVRPHEVLHRGAFLEELGIAHDGEVGRAAACTQLTSHDGRQLLRRAHGHGGLLHDHLEAVHVAPDRAGRRMDMRQVRAAVVRGRRAHGDELHLAESDARRHVRGKQEPAFLDVALGDLLQARFVDRHAPLLQCADLRGIEIEAEHVVAELGQAGTCHEADVARADDGDVHSLELLLFFARLRAVVRA
jgi:hypothetical protein